MAEFETPLQAGLFHQRDAPCGDISFLPYWARSRVQYAQNLLECSDEPIEYDDEDEDYRDNCFFFPEDCTRAPIKDAEVETCKGPVTCVASEVDGDWDDTMTPELPDIKMLDTEALSDLLEDNLSPPEITSILVFATNGAIFAYASPLPPRQLRNLSATYGAAYTTYAKTASTGNLTGVNPASHPSSFVTAPSVSLGDVGSIVFEQDNQVAVVTKIADKVLLATVGPSKLENAEEANDTKVDNAADTASPVEPPSNGPHAGTNGPSSAASSSQPADSASSHNDPNRHPDSLLEAQYEIDRSSDLARLAGLNLNSSPEILLALESKSAALGRFLAQKLRDLETPEDF
ncbi:hypothetical protein VTN77DRAFT_6400 [Rasamsonia byssochlamydoides]|uniref:uncharacterized protein n=1 Tax=Rasamsonia byssochlamydoides TaxID=89139 RepID=UPI0037439541